MHMIIFLKKQTTNHLKKQRLTQTQKKNSKKKELFFLRYAYAYMHMHMHIKKFFYFFEKTQPICLYICVLEILWKKSWKKKLFFICNMHMHIAVDQKLTFFGIFFCKSSIRWFLRSLVVIFLKNIIICIWIEKICIWKKSLKVCPCFFSCCRFMTVGMNKT